MPSINVDLLGPVPTTELPSRAAPPPAIEASSEPSFGNHLRRSGDTPKRAAVPDAETTDPSEDDSRVDGTDPVIGEADRTNEKERDDDSERSDQQEPPQMDFGAKEVRQEAQVKTDVAETAIVAETETEAPTTARPVATEVDRVATGLAPEPKHSSRRESEAKLRPHDAPPTRGETAHRSVSEHAAPKVNQSAKRPVGDVHQTRRPASSSGQRAAGSRQAEPAAPPSQAGGDVEAFSFDRSLASGTGSDDGLKQTPASIPDGPATTPSRLAVHVTRHGAARADGPNITEAERAKFIQRVSRVFHAAERRGGPIRLRLSPPELGSLRLEVQIDAGVMTARVEAETPAARAILLDNLTALRERLAQQDIRIEQFDVDVMGRQSSGLPDRAAGNTDPNDRQPHRAARFGADESDQSQERPVPRRPGTDGQLDVVV